MAALAAAALLGSTTEFPLRRADKNPPDLDKLIRKLMPFSKDAKPVATSSSARPFHAIVIGSGFGGAITACRMAEQGARVLILERGKRLDSGPRLGHGARPQLREFDDDWVWDGNRPEHRNGWIEFRRFKTVSTILGAGVGGGSLIFSNVYAIPSRSTFLEGWPKEITYEEMLPFYERTGAVVGTEKIPDQEQSARSLLLSEAAASLDEMSRYKKLDLTITFRGERFPLNQPESLPREIIGNDSQCVHRGDCSLGCPFQAKHTLDTNYIEEAESHGATLRELQLVTQIDRIPRGYRLTIVDLRGGRRRRYTIETSTLVIAAGSLGTTELLLRSRVSGGLTGLSPVLGHKWSPNGFFLVPTFFKDRLLFPSVGPHITAALDFTDGSKNGQRFWIEDGGFPRSAIKVLNEWLLEPHNDSWGSMAAKSARRMLKKVDYYWFEDLIDNMMPWTVQGVDRSDGVMSLRNGQLDLDWNLSSSYPLVKEVVATLEAICKRLGGEFFIPFANSPPRHQPTAHPLGGCSMGDSWETAVVDHRGEVFGYPRLYIADGSVVPGALGCPPSRTIAALAERTADLLARNVTGAPASGITRVLGPSTSTDFTVGDAPDRGGLRSPAPPGARKIIVTAFDARLVDVRSFSPQSPYTLRFRVGTPVPENLAQGDITVTNVPPTGLKAHWIVTSTNVGFIESPKVQIEHRNGTWLAEFDLDIPAEGESAAVNLSVRTTDQPGEVFVTIMSGKEQYRRLTVKLDIGVQLQDDVVAIAPAHINLRTTHEWTTPPEHIAVDVYSNLARLTTVIGTNDYGTVDWRGKSGALKNPILRVRQALEKFRVKWEKHLNDVDQANLETRLAGSKWFANIRPDVGWSKLDNCSDPDHQRAFDQLASESELRALAHEGYGLFDACFRDSDLRNIIMKLLPGSRVDFNWTERGGGDWVSHVPWSLMYLDPLKTGERVDCERFLGLRFRIGSKSWEPKAPSRALGAPADVNLLHFLYWGQDPNDEITIQSSWQRKTFGQWGDHQHFLPLDPAVPDPKTQVLLALESPSPVPAGVLYFYCQCSVKDGSDPVLQFGDTGQGPNVIRANEIYQGRLESEPLVFANACTTVAGDPQGTNDLEATFFRRDIRAFVGTETKVPITLASRFAWLFFQFFLRKADRDHKPMAAGEALAQARLFLWTQYRNPGGLFYCLVNQYNLYLASNQEVAAMQRN